MPSWVQRIVICFSFIVLVVGVARAGTLEDALVALEQREFEKAVNLLTPLAEQGNARAQAELGLLYEVGVGVETDIDRSVDLYRKSADQGFALGQVRLGALYELGHGVEQDRNEAIRLYTLAATQGLTEAEGNLCEAYMLSDEQKSDWTTGMPWCLKAADHGDARAQFRVGLAHYYGDAVQQSAQMAYVMMSKAAAQGHPMAIYNQAYMLVSGDGVEMNMARGMALMEKAALIGVHYGFVTLASGYEFGEGLPKNPNRAMYWYRQALLAYYPQSLVGLGRLAADGYSDPAIAPKELAYTAWSLAVEACPSERDRAEAQSHLDRLTLSAGELKMAKDRLQEAKLGGIESYTTEVVNSCRMVDIIAAPDVAKASQDCRRLAALGLPIGEYNLSWMKMHGHIVALDVEGGVNLLKRAAEEDFAVAELELGKAYANGEGMKQDLRQALAWVLVAEQRIPLSGLSSNYLEDARKYIAALRDKLPKKDIAWAEAWRQDFIAEHPSPY